VAGDAFAGIYNAELPYVWRTLARLGVATSDLADRTHDVFVVVLRTLPLFDASRPVRPWLFGIAFRVASEHRRGRRYERAVRQELLDAPSEPADAFISAAESEHRRFLLLALGGIPLERRAVFLLHDVDEQPMPVVADTLTIPVNTAYSRLRLARKELTRAVRRMMVGGRP
jgi:RNA polymerase sigma-70 factor (ECF subfamily)